MGHSDFMAAACPARFATCSMQRTLMELFQVFAKSATKIVWNSESPH
jgi:hypothetical protein